MANVTANEQLMLELINLARLDPLAEAQRLGIDLNEGLAPGTITGDAKQPLAFNNQLVTAARNHSVWQIDTDVFSHTGAGGSDPGDRMTAAGYVFEGSWGWGENISWRGAIPGPVDAAEAIIVQHDGLFLSAGHRKNILTDYVREAGIGQAVGPFIQDGKTWSASVVTQDFALSGSRIFLTGVVYQDTNGDSRYGLGEGLGSRQVSLLRNGAQTAVQTNAHGGYESVIGAGLNRVTFAGVTPVVVDVQITDENIKLDLAGTTVQSSTSLTLVSGANVAELLGVAPLGIQGSGAAERLLGNRGANGLAGGGGADTLDGGLGADTLEGGFGNDVYRIDDADLVVELAGQGTDRVESAIAYTLGANLENLTLLGTGAKGTGNGAANRISGNAAANVLTGVTGNDTLNGLVGNDTLYGSGGNDSLSGAGGNDSLVGGAGADTLAGGTGVDRFKFVTTADAVDSLADFASGTDRILVVSKNFGGLNLGALDASRFVAAGAPLPAVAAFVYDASTGSLSFDADGSGSASAAVQIAALTGPKALMAGDIQVAAA
jgi:Ca2+-binding RTX toxin-like protein